MSVHLSVFVSFYLLLLAHLSWRLIDELIVSQASVVRSSSSFFKQHFLWSHEADPYQISHICIYWHTSCVRTAMALARGKEWWCFLSRSDKNSGCCATYSCHWLVVGKVKIGIYCCLTADILTEVSQKCSLSSAQPNISMLSKPLNLNIWLVTVAAKKAKIAKKY